ncbi:hypothetical protein ACHAQH_005267 [Verticillium albo-atrum]
MDPAVVSQRPETGILAPRAPACDNCKHRKTKCDRAIPCSSCLTANLTCRATRIKPEKRQRVLISARYDEALESVDTRLQEVLSTVTALQRDVQRQPGPAVQGQPGLQRAADFPSGVPADILPGTSVIEGYKGQPSFEAQVRQMAGTLGAMTINPMSQVAETDVETSLAVQQILDSCATPGAVPVEANRANLQPFFEKYPEFANHILPPSDAVLKMLRLAQRDKQWFFVDVGIFDEVEFTEMCKLVFFATDPYNLSTWSIVNTGLFYMFLGLKPDRYHELGLSDSEVGHIIGLLARNTETSVDSFQVCTEPDVKTCQALALLGTFCMKSGQLSKAWRLISAAARMSIDLGFHRIPLSVRGSQETLKRWHIFCMAYDEFDGMSWWLYAPNKGVAIFFTIAFSTTMVVHAWQAIRYKTYFNSCIFAVCGLTYAAGFALRAWGAFENYSGLENLIPFICSVCLIAITPPLLALVDYHIFGQVLYYVPYLSPIHPGRVVWLFGIVSWVIEGLNGTGASYAANPHANSMIGHIMMRASYALQLIINISFLALVIFFHRRCINARVAGARAVRYTLITIYTSVALILVRTVYRTVEHYAMEEIDDKDIRSPVDIPVVVRYEVYFCVFDAALMLVNLILWNFMHTSRYLPADNKTYIARDGVTEVKGSGWQDPRSKSARMMDPFDLMSMCGCRKRQKGRPSEWVDNIEVGSMDAMRAI